MAGSEKTGYENATDHLLENAYYIVTPPEGLDQSGSETGNIPPKYAENAKDVYKRQGHIRRIQLYNFSFLSRK